MKVAILVEEQYQVLEVWYPYLRFREEGIETLFIGSGTKKVYGSKEGYPAQEDMSIDNARVQDFAAVVIPGGWAPDFLRRHASINNFVREMFANGKVVASICHGGWVLASAGILKGRKATSFIAIKDDIVNAGAEYLDKEVVVDGNLITSRTPNDLPAFSKAILKLIKP
jgi:protease I